MRRGSWRDFLSGGGTRVLGELAVGVIAVATLFVYVPESRPLTVGFCVFLLAALLLPKKILSFVGRIVTFGFAVIFRLVALGVVIGLVVFVVKKPSVIVSFFAYVLAYVVYVGGIVLVVGGVYWAWENRWRLSPAQRRREAKIQKAVDAYRRREEEERRRAESARVFEAFRSGYEAGQLSAGRERAPDSPVDRGKHE